MTDQDHQHDTLPTLWDDSHDAANPDSHGAEDFTSAEAEDDSLDIDLDDIFQNLGAPESRQRQIKKPSAETLPDTAEIAERAFGQWQRQRRVLFIHRRRCQHCHTIHTLPNDRVLTEYRHRRNGSQSWASAGPGDLGLRHQIEYLDGKPLECCQHCFAQPMTDPENPETPE